MKAIAGLGVLVVSALAAACGGTPGDSQKELTYYHDVKPIVDSKCVFCHKADGIGPFELTAYTDLTERSGLIQHVVENRIMPPWPPGQSCNQYDGDRSLSDEQLDTILQWIDQDMPEGSPDEEGQSLPDDRVKLSRVDRTLEIAEPYTPTVLPDEYRCFVMPWDETTKKYITGFQVNPGNSSIVHHVIVYHAPASAAAEYQSLDEADAEPGYQCFGGPGGDSDFMVAAWAPGELGQDFPAGTGIEMNPDDLLILQVHYHTYNGNGPDQTTVDLKLDDDVSRQAGLVFWTDPSWPSGNMPIPAHNLDVEKIFSADPTEITSGLPIKIYAAGLHMHTLGRSASLVIEQEDGTEDCLLDIQNWDFDWQGAFRFTEPRIITAGSQLRLTCDWANTTDVDKNWGDGTDDEMCLAIVYASLP